MSDRALGGHCTDDHENHAAQQKMLTLEQLLCKKHV